MDNPVTAIYNSPLGVIGIRCNADSVTSIEFDDSEMHSVHLATSIPPAADKCIEQLNEYFAGRRHEFDLPISINGTPFQMHVWHLLQGIPFGKTISYLELSKKFGDVKAIRAVASANGKNPFAIVIPCHRVTGSKGDLVGYAGKIWRKRWLLEHESTIVSRQQVLFQDEAVSRK